jgi:hypothetical protein
MKITALALLASTVLATPALASPSVYTVAPADPRAVTVKGVGDGRADDGPAIQAAIDAAAARSDTPGHPASLADGEASAVIFINEGPTASSVRCSCGRGYGCSGSARRAR